MTTLFICPECVAEYDRTGTCEVCDVELVERSAADYGLDEEEVDKEDGAELLTSEKEEDEDGLSSFDVLAEEEDELFGADKYDDDDGI